MFEVFFGIIGLIILYVVLLFLGVGVFVAIIRGWPLLLGLALTSGGYYLATIYGNSNGGVKVVSASA